MFNYFRKYEYFKNIPVSMYLGDPLEGRSVKQFWDVRRHKKSGIWQYRNAGNPSNTPFWCIIDRFIVADLEKAYLKNELK